MSDKKTFAAPAPKTTKIKRPSTVSLATSSTSRKLPSVPSSALKEKPRPKPKSNTNTTIADLDMTTIKDGGPNPPDFATDYNQIAYGKFLRSMLEECFVNDKIEREETPIDIQMVQLADRFQKTMDVLDKTNRRLKDINFVVEQKRLMDLKSRQSDSFYTSQSTFNSQEVLQNISDIEQSSLDKLQTKNIDFGFNKESGHQKLLNAVNEAIEGLEDIKNHSHLDMNKCESYAKSKTYLDKLEEDRLDMDGLMTDIEGKFPVFSEKLLKEASERFAKMIDKGDDDDDDDDDSDD